MINTKFLADGLSGLSRRLRTRKSVRRRGRPGKHRLQVAAEISLLEPRCLLSGKGLAVSHHIEQAVGHHTQISPQAQNGAPVIINFAGYQWNTNYNWSQDSGNYLNGQLWSPENATVDASGYLHLKITNQPDTNKGSGIAGVSADAELVAKADGTPFNPGYGTYLISAKTNGTFDKFAQNPLAIFAAFTYQNLHGVGHVDGKQIADLPSSLVAKLRPGMSIDGNLGESGLPIFKADTTIDRIEGNTVILTLGANVGPQDLHTFYFTNNNEVNPVTKLINRKRELDMLEVSRFGNKNEPTNGQFVLQPTEPKDGGSEQNIKRITLKEAESQGITVVMHWTGPHTLVTFEVYYGLYTLGHLPKTPDITYTTPPEQKKYVPDSSYQTFHLNVWQAWWQFDKNGNTDHPNPTEVIVTNFQYSANRAQSQGGKSK